MRARRIEIHDTVLDCGGLCMCNRYVDGLGIMGSSDPDNLSAKSGPDRRTRLHRSDRGRIARLQRLNPTFEMRSFSTPKKTMTSRCQEGLSEVAFTNARASTERQPNPRSMNQNRLPRVEDRSLQLSLDHGQLCGDRGLYLWPLHQAIGREFRLDREATSADSALLH